jgi:hypothetical protein
MDGSAAQSIYRLEKERAMQERRLSHTALMAEAKEAFNKLLADAQLARKGGRPRTNPLPPGARPPVKPAAAPVAAAPQSLPRAERGEPVKKAAPVKADAKQARRKTDKGQSKAPKAKAVKASATKASAKPAKKTQAKRAKPQPKGSLRSKKVR